MHLSNKIPENPNSLLVQSYPSVCLTLALLRFLMKGASPDEMSTYLKLLVLVPSLKGKLGGIRDPQDFRVLTELLLWPRLIRVLCLYDSLCQFEQHLGRETESIV